MPLTRAQAQKLKLQEMQLELEQDLNDDIDADAEVFESSANEEEKGEDEIIEQRDLQLKQEPGVTPEQNALLKELYCNRGLMFGRDRLYAYISENHREMNIRRRQIASWLSCQQVSQLFKPTRQTKIIQPTVLSKPYAQVACDLADMQLHEADGYIYIFMMVDLFSKKCWAVPLMNKQAATVSDALTQVLRKMLNSPRVLRSDRGSEFISSEFQAVLKANGIKHILSLAHCPQSNGQIERTNGIIKKLIAMYKIYHNNYKWYTYLDLLVGNYNNTISRVTKFTPNKAEVATEEDCKLIHDRIYKSVIPNRELVLPKFRIGDKVRLKLDFSNDGQFAKKGTTERWTREIYEVATLTCSRTSVSLPHYKVKDLNSNKVYDSRLYNEDLQLAEVVENKVIQDEKFKVSKIVQRMPNPASGEDGFLVAWVGYRDATWVSYHSLKEDLPKLVKEFLRNS